MQPIGYRLRLESRRSQPQKPLASNITKLSDLDQQIAQLESSIHDSASDDDSDEEEEELEEVFVEVEGDLAVEKDRSGKIIRLISSNIHQDDFIDKLPDNLLPIPMNKRSHSGNSSSSLSAMTHSRVRFVDDSTSSSSKRHKDSHTTAGVSVSTGSRLSAASVKSYVASYETSSANKKPFWCRVCKFTGQDYDDFLNHKQSSSHQRAEDIDRKASYCKLCRKQFTSPEQLKEHLQGTAHKEKLAHVQGQAAYRKRGFS
jgi:hypothetical protein